MLKQFKQQPSLVDNLKLQFTSKNQAFCVWLIIKSMIASIGENINFNNDTINGDIDNSNHDDNLHAD